MIKLEDYSRAELKKLAEEKNMTGYHNLSRAELIKELNIFLNKTEQKIDEMIAEAVALEEKVKKPLSVKALQWQTYLKRINIKPEAFIARFPQHEEVEFIKELI